jgi:hypothetical protein
MINTKKLRTCYKKRYRVNHRRYRNSRKTKKNLDKQIQNGGNTKDNFEVTTLRNIDQDRIDKMKISNYVNANIDWGIMPGPPPTDCVIM